MGGEGGVVCGLRNMIYKYERRDGKRAGIVGWRKETKRNERKRKETKHTKRKEGTPAC